MKKALALLLSFAMLFTVLTVNVFAATTPTIAITDVTVAADEDATITLKLSDFSEVKGMDLTVTATAGIKFTAVDSELVAEGNYTLADQKLHIVDLTDVTTATIVITAEVTADGTVSVTADLAKSGTALFEAGEVSIDSEGTVTIKSVETSGTATGTVETPTTLKNEDEGYFIPYGAVYVKNGDGSYTYVKKNSDGGFTITEDVKWNKFEIPAGGFGTFAYSTSLNAVTTSAVQFATYSNKLGTASEHGTMLIAGDWAEFKEKYPTRTEAELIAQLSKVYDNNIGTNDYVNVTFNSKAHAIEVRKVKQTNYMWQDKNNGILEYALRVNGLEANDDYVAVGYYISNSAETLSATIKEYTYTVAE